MSSSQELEAEKLRQTKRIEGRKNDHTRRLMKQHEDAFTKIKRYYNDITHNNLDLIKSLKVLCTCQTPDTCLASFLPIHDTTPRP